MNSSTTLSGNVSDEPNTQTTRASARPLRVQMLGGSRVGKTCLVAGLALLNDESGGQTFVLPTDDETKQVFHRLRESLASGHWPSKTSMVNTLSMAVIRGNKRVDVQLVDFAGENFSDAMERGNSTEQAKAIQSQVEKADLLLILLDGAIVDQRARLDGTALIQAVFERMNADEIHNLETIVVLTKRDLCINTPMQSGKDLEQVVANQAPGLATFLTTQDVATHYIPISVCGPGGRSESGDPVFEEMNPEGYDDLFEALFSRGARKRARRLKWVIASAILAVVLLAGFVQMRNQGIKEEGETIAKTETEIGELPQNVAPDNKQKLKDRYTAEFATAQKNIEASGNTQSIDNELDKFKEMAPQHRVIVSALWEDLMKHADRRKEQLRYEYVLNSEKLGDGDLVKVIGDYLRAFPKGQHSEEVIGKLNDINRARYLTARGNVKAIPVTTAAALSQKKDAITVFLRDHGMELNDDDKASITSARDIASELLAPRQYHCKLIRTSGLDTPRDHGVKIYIADELIADFNDSGDVREKSWNRDFTVSWNAGQSIRIVLSNYDTIDQDMAYFEDRTPVAITIFTGKRKPTRYGTTGNLFGTDFNTTKPEFQIEFSCEELPNEKLKTIADYLLPGDAW